MYNTIVIENIDYKEQFEAINEIEDSGSLFIITRNMIDSNGVLEHNFFDIINEYGDKGFNYINTIICTLDGKSQDKENKIINNKIYYLIWFVKSLDEMYFDKDEIREKHIWKNVEWGKRKKNYNPKGKDPGNVWIPTNDDGKGKITEHIIMNFEEVLTRCINATSNSGENVYIKSSEAIDEKFLPLDRKYKLEYYEENKKTKVIPKYRLSNNKEKKNLVLKNEVNFETSEDMYKINSNTIDLMITSPPYWDLKNYYKDGQIGQETYEEYQIRLDKVWKEVYRVLKRNGSMWININTRTRNKKPILIPCDIINRCKKIGFKLRDIVIWHKSSGIPTHKNNIVDRHEYLLWFSKGEEIKFNKEKLFLIEDYTNEYLNNGDIWNINRKAGTVGKNYVHPAIYPKELVDRIISLCSKEGDIILDPFLGSGTTMISAMNNKRSFVGYEYNEEFIDLIEHRLLNENLSNQNVNYYIGNKLIKKEYLEGENEIFR